MSALTEKDLADLCTAVEIADLVALSCVRGADDVARLLDELDRHGADRLDVVLKIETRQAFEELPRLLLTAMRRPGAAVMSARGDLAVEVGHERMAELQEEILWLCEAAHLPVIWATQVLEQLAERGRPSRAEITDAAMGERSECVMFNKGLTSSTRSASSTTSCAGGRGITTRRTRCCGRCGPGTWSRCHHHRRRAHGGGLDDREDA